MNENWPISDIDPLAPAAWKRIEDGVFAQLDASADRAKTIVDAPSRSRLPWLAGGAGVLAAAAALALVVSSDKASVEGTHASRIVTTSAPTELTVADATVTVAPASSLATRVRGEDATLQLERGTVHCRVPKRKQGQEFVVEAGNMRVYVVGTEFAVMRHGDTGSVAVMEGTVRVAHRGRYQLVHAGETWSPDAEGEEYVFNTLDARKKRRRRTHRKRRTKHEPQVTEEVAADDSEIEPEVPEISEAQRLYREAASLEGKAPNAAVKLYRQAAAHSGAWAALALYAHGRLELDRGNKQSGERLLRSYLRRFPDGRNAHDARELLGQ